ncbi:hypothetical protein E2542_SST02572 [Spatholobus suberectus]|nr:hypothetical protein E2542_SST02572 [Spatholobus suberectus]
MISQIAFPPSHSDLLLFQEPQVRALSLAPQIVSINPYALSVFGFRLNAFSAANQTSRIFLLSFLSALVRELTVLIRLRGIFFDVGVSFMQLFCFWFWQSRSV